MRCTFEWEQALHGQTKIVSAWRSPAPFLRSFVPPMPNGCNPNVLILGAMTFGQSKPQGCLQRWPDGFTRPQTSSGGQGKAAKFQFPTTTPKQESCTPVGPALSRPGALIRNRPRARCGPAGATAGYQAEGSHHPPETASAPWVYRTGQFRQEPHFGGPRRGILPDRFARASMSFFGQPL